MLDEYNAETNQDEHKSIYQSNVGYALDSEQYYKFMKLDDSIVSKAQVDKWGTLQEIVNHLSFDTNFNIINKANDTDDSFILFEKENEENTYKKANSFASLYNNPDSEDLDIEHQIIPAAMKYTYIAQYAVAWTRPQYWIQMPIAGDYDELIGVDGSNTATPENIPINIQSLVEGDTSVETEATYSKLRLAIYSGLHEIEYKGGGHPSFVDKAYYPIAYVEALAEYFQETLKPKYFGEKGVNPFRLDYLNNEIYIKSAQVDTINLFKLEFTLKNKIDVKSRFTANNKAFRCVKIERTINSKGFGEIVKGEFYPFD